MTRKLRLGTEQGLEPQAQAAPASKSVPDMGTIPDTDPDDYDYDNEGHTEYPARWVVELRARMKKMGITH